MLDSNVSSWEGSRLRVRWKSKLTASFSRLALDVTHPKANFFSEFEDLIELISAPEHSSSFGGSYFKFSGSCLGNNGLKWWSIVGDWTNLFEMLDWEAEWEESACANATRSPAALISPVMFFVDSKYWMSHGKDVRQSVRYPWNVHLKPKNLTTCPPIKSVNYASAKKLRGENIELQRY